MRRFNRLVRTVCDAVASAACDVLCGKSLSRKGNKRAQRFRSPGWRVGTMREALQTAAARIHPTLHIMHFITRTLFI